MILKFSDKFGSAPSKTSYQRIVLVSTEKHLDTLSPDDADVLVVTTELSVSWAWRNLGGEAVLTDAFLEDWTSDQYGAAGSVFIDAASWVYLDETDASQFAGVSLGRQFDSQIATADYMFRRIHAALDAICQTFTPKYIELRGVRAYCDMLDITNIEVLVQDICTKNNVAFSRHNTETLRSDSLHQDFAVFAGSSTMQIRPIYRLRDVFVGCVELICKLRFVFCRNKRSVFFLLSDLASEGIILSKSPRSFSPVFIGQATRKTPKYIFQCLMNGSALVSMPQEKINPSDIHDVRKIIARYRDAWNRLPPLTAREQARRHFVETYLFQSERLHAMAGFVRRTRKLFNRIKLARVVVSDVRPARSRVVAEIAIIVGIPIEELLNGIFVTPVRDGARCGDRGQTPLVDRNLAWSEYLGRAYPNKALAHLSVAAEYPAVDVLIPR